MQPLKKLLKSKSSKQSCGDEAVKADEVNEPIQEDVAITQIENLAVEEEKDEVVMEETITSTEEKFEAVTPGEELIVEETSVEEVEAVAEETKLEEVIAEEIIPTTTESTPVMAPEERQATATVDFTGNWTLIVDESFKSEYDSYLRKLGQPILVRTVAMTVIGSTKEEAIQSEGGKQLYIRGMNVRGSWERTLEASETDVVGEGMHAVEGHVLKPMVTADEEEVEVASWWEDDGKVHRSWVVGGKKYGGGR